jgi:phosphoribosylamine--glycine ligase
MSSKETPMNVLILGSGGREHALAWKIDESPLCSKVFVAPGNPGMEVEDQITTVDLNPSHHDSLLKFCHSYEIGLVVVGPEKYLEEGVCDFLNANKVKCFGPNSGAAKIETSKEYAKELMTRGGIPTARYMGFSDASVAKSFIKSWPWEEGVVIKVDGPAAGKGVFVCESAVYASEVVDEILIRKKMGDHVERIIIEERLVGREVSAFALCKDDDFTFLGMACDYKRALEGDLGPNTGGMGAYTPASWVSLKEKEEILEITEKTLKALVNLENPFSGVLFTGFMMTEAGPRVLEFNARFGDPETQALLPLLEEDLLELILSTLEGSYSKKRKNKEIKQKAGYSVHVVKAAAGYPGIGGKVVQKGDKIVLKELEENKESKLFFAGVAKSRENHLETSGGRVLGVSAWAKSLEEARENVYKSLERSSFSGEQLRGDIGL